MFELVLMDSLIDSNFLKRANQFTWLTGLAVTVYKVHFINNNIIAIIHVHVLNKSI